eukprot:TRINITY_DN1476_c0_g1_i1.p1 TRINITY_DN1476_c0_g1~~TRINITY_DN1476_c0_g1_i1.p1  ORF type:complete len:274 (+),score=104.47 TRINITY_DN1476_c0_g1_i1:120-941(+)
MELDDCAYPALHSVIATADPEIGFKDCDYAFLVGAMPRREGMERADLLKANANIFKVQGAAIDKVASRDIKVVVVGNPANTNAAITSACAPSIPKANITAMTRLDHHRGQSLIARSLDLPVTSVKHFCIWGNHSTTQYPDVSYATANNTAVKALKDDAWLHGEFITTVQKRGGAVIKARGASSAASAAHAALSHMYDWIHGTKADEWTSMAVPSDGSYGVAPGVVFSFPVTCKDGKYSIVQGLKIDEFSQKMFDATDAELRKEKDTAFTHLGL